MSLSAERTAIAERAIRQTFERASVAWQAIPHWDVHDPGRVCIRNEVIFRLANPATQQSKQPSESPFGIDSLEPEAEYVKFEVTMAQAIALTPDALLTSVIPRTVALAEQVDKSVFKVLRGPAMLTAQSATETTATKTTSSGTTSDWYRPLYVPSPAIRGMPAQPAITQDILKGLLDGRELLEDSGYRAPCCLIASSAHFKELNQLVDGELVKEKLLAGANVNSLHRTTQLDVGDTNTNLSLMLGRMQEIAPGRAAEASSGEEPVDLAVSVPPSLEVIGETDTGTIELAVRIRFATRVKDERGVVVLYG